MQNPFTPGGANYYWYEYQGALDALRDAVNPSAEVIHNPKAYLVLFNDAKRRGAK